MKKIIALAAIALALAVSGSVASAATYTRDLTIGSTGSDVVALQSALESMGYLTMPAGVSKGYFGTLTQQALIKYQTAKGISPAAGYFGPITRASVEAAPAGDDDSSDDSDSDSDMSDDEASLEQFDLSSGDDSDVEEDATGEVAEIEFDVEDGDIELNRVDLKLVGSGDETDPWDTFESLSLLVDGDEIGSVDLSDEDEYLDEDEGTVRISGLDTQFKDGDTATIVVAITTQGNVDGTDDGEAWVINVEDNGIRAVDGAGIDQYIGDDSETVAFDVEEAGADDELNVSTSADDPESTTFKVEENSKSDPATIFSFDLESEESDIEIDTIEIDVETGTADVNDVVADFTLDIDGEEFTDWDFVGSGAATSTTISFDIDKEYTLDADSEVVVSLIAEFKAANGTNYATTGETITASIADAAIEGEGADDIVSDGVATGEEHNLEIAGIIVDESGFSDEGVNENNDAVTSKDFTFTFEVTAFEEDFYIATSSVTTFYEGAGTASTSVTVDSTGDEDTDGVFTVEQGETETFTVVVTISGVSADGQYRVGLDTVKYTENSNGITARSTKDVVNSDFRTAYSTVNN